MLRFWSVILVVLSLAACSSAPPKAGRSGSGPAYGDNALRTMPPGSPRFVDHSIGREEISIQAMSLVGIPYRWGGNTPDSGFDCSGLVRYVVARAADVDLPRTTADISRRGDAIEPDEVAPGDLIFFNTTGRPHSHVGIYVGKLRFVNAPSTGGTVRLDYLTNPYWAKRFDGIRRVAPPLARPSPFDAPTEQAATGKTMVPMDPPALNAAVPAAAPRSAQVDGAYSAQTAARQPTETLRSTTSAAPAYALAPATTSAAAPVAATATLPRASSTPSATAAAEDPIDAAADAFEPPPPAAAQAQRQAKRAGTLPVPRPATPGEANSPTMRAATIPQFQAAPGPTADDPIAQFANGSE